MRFSSTVVKFLLALTVSFTFMANAALAAEPVKVALQALKVVDVNGKETFTESKTAKPGEVLEYRAVYSNVSKKIITNLAATLPVPVGMEYVALSVKPAGALASTDGKVFSAMPLMRKNASGKAETVPLADYRALRWTVSSLQPGKPFEVSARMRVSAVAPGQKK